jgi:hypothetical protein
MRCENFQRKSVLTSAGESRRRGPWRSRGRGRKFRPESLAICEDEHRPAVKKIEQFVCFSLIIERISRRQVYPVPGCALGLPRKSIIFLFVLLFFMKSKVFIKYCIIFQEIETFSNIFQKIETFSDIFHDIVTLKA